MARKPTSFTDSGTLLATTHELEGGLCVRLRLTRPSDARRIRAFLDRLSPRTRQRRFFSAMPTVPERVVRHFSFFDPRKRLVIAATTPGEGGEEIVGLADISFLETGLAEIGMVVEDERQQRGIGTLLSEAIASLAVQHGATQLKSQLLESTSAALRLMGRIGPPVQTVEDGNPVLYTRLPARSRYAA